MKTPLRPIDPFTAARPRPAESVPAHATTPEDLHRAGAPRPVRADTTARAVEVYSKMQDSARIAQGARVEQQREAFAPQREKVLAAARQNLPVPDAARAAKVPESTARKWIKEAGVTPPKGKPGPKPPAAKDIVQIGLLRTEEEGPAEIATAEEDRDIIHKGDLLIVTKREDDGRCKVVLRKGPPMISVPPTLRVRKTGETYTAPEPPARTLAPVLPEGVELPPLTVRVRPAVPRVDFEDPPAAESPAPVVQTIAPASGTGRSGQLTRDARIAAGLRGLADAAAALAAALEAP